MYKLKFKSERGITLLEILVVLVLLALVMGITVSSLVRSDGSKLKESARKLTGSIRYLYNEAILQHQYIRIVFDFESSTYHFEFNRDPHFIHMQKEDDQKEEENEAAQENSTFTVSNKLLLKKVKLPHGIKVKDIFVYHAPTARSEGKEYIYILPNGWVEPAVINLSNEDETQFLSLEIQPLTGKTTIRGEYFEPKDLKMQFSNESS